MHIHVIDKYKSRRLLIRDFLVLNGNDVHVSSKPNLKQEFDIIIIDIDSYILCKSKRFKGKILVIGDSRQDDLGVPVIHMNFTLSELQERILKLGDK